jgi:hypothetical protein
MSKRICPNCATTITSITPTGESALYSPGKAFILCEPCYFAEDDVIEAAGTNVIPKLIKKYAGSRVKAKEESYA